MKRVYGPPSTIYNNEMHHSRDRNDTIELSTNPGGRSRSALPNAFRMPAKA